MSPPLITLTINLDAVIGNWRAINDRLASGAAAAVVKADAYGLGVAQVGPALARAGCDTFFVATLDEGIALRALLPQAVIHVLSGPVPGAAAEFADHALVPVLNSLEQVDTWQALALQRLKPLPATLHMDTGMTRLGVDLGEVERLALDPGRWAGIQWVLGMTHLACADEADHPLNPTQLARFGQALVRLPMPVRSLAASSGIFLGPEFHLDLVRPGAALYGLNPCPGQPNPMRPTVTLQARILQVRDVDSPRTVGYGASRPVRTGQRIATVAAGYADGVFRSLGNAGLGVVAGVKVPMVGRVSMDLITFDVSALPPGAVQPGQMVDLIGPDLDADTVALLAGTIGYEVLTQLPRRAHRHYVGTEA